MLFESFEPVYPLLKRHVMSCVTRNYQIIRTCSNNISIPPTQPVKQHRVFCLKYHNTIKPTLGEEVAAMIIHNVSTLFHHILKLITNLEMSNMKMYVSNSYIIQVNKGVHSYCPRRRRGWILAYRCEKS